MDWVERSLAAKVEGVDWLQAAADEGVLGFLHPVEMAKLHELAEGRDVLEVGAFKGLSAWVMAHSAKSVHSVDTFRAYGDGQTQMEELTTLDLYLAATARYPNVSHFVGTSEEAHAQIKRKFDMIFIDAMHTFEDVDADIARWWPRVKPGGVFCLHDYGHDNYPGVKLAADKHFGDLGPYDPGKQNWVVTLRWVWKP